MLVRKLIAKDDSSGGKGQKMLENGAHRWRDAENRKETQFSGKKNWRRWTLDPLERQGFN